MVIIKSEGGIKMKPSDFELKELDNNISILWCELENKNLFIRDAAELVKKVFPNISHSKAVEVIKDWKLHNKWTEVK